MCYSAIVKQRVKKLALQFSARIDYEEYSELFFRRLQGQKLLINKGLEYDFIKDPKTPVEKKAKKAIGEWHENQIQRLEKELLAQTKRFEDAEMSLEKTTTKKAENDKRVATNKIAKAKKDLEKHRSADLKSPSEERIFPHHYVSVICLDEKGKKVIRPMRYLMRPHDKDESFDFKFGGCYNARFDSLKKVAWWRDSLESRRGFIVITGFYENVPVVAYKKKNKLPKSEEGKENIVVYFEPEGEQELIVPVVWDVWKDKGKPDLYSFAMITDDPTPEVEAAGHDRTPKVLLESAADEWLFAADSKSALAVLENLEDVYFSHKVIGVA